MKKIVVDVENTTTKLSDKYRDYSPYNRKNKLVAIGWMLMVDNKLAPVKYIFLAHKHQGPIDTALFEEFKKDLAEAEFAIAHHAKHDLAWLKEAGFDIDHLRINDTMIMEYVMARGRTDISFKLADTCPRYEGIACKADSIFDTYPDLMIDEMPIDEVEVYGRADIQATAELYLAQCQRLARSDYRGLAPTIHMMHDFCKILMEIERNGVKIDIRALNKVGEDFTTEAGRLKLELNTFVRSYMGDTPVNLDSPAQLSEVVYSRRITEGSEKDWIRTFNIGKDQRNKNLKRPYFSYVEFADHVRNMTDVVYRTEATQCAECKGKGKVHKSNKDGTVRLKPNKCKPCCATGFIYTNTSTPAGFKLKPKSVYWTTISGFSTSKTFLQELLDDINPNTQSDAKKFLEASVKLNAVSSYLSTFVGGIQTFVQKDTLILHPNFNQCITSTGRLSCTNPNLQNQPREKTFPIRKVFNTRFEGGMLIEADFKTLEFTAAVHLAKDERGKQDILGGLDIHKQTAKILTEAGEITDRQGAKKHTFKPLYGGRTGTKAQQTYYEAFLGELYTGIGEWHNILQEEAIKTKMITLPTGRQFLFPDTKRNKWGGATQATQIVNFPVQSFATAEITPIAIIRLHKEMKALNLKSLLVLTVHDSIYADCVAEEIEVMGQLMQKLAFFAEDELKKRYNITMFLPLAVEVKIGYNILDMKPIEDYNALQEQRRCS